MPEALAVVLVVFVSAVIYIICWFQARDPALQNADLEAVRVRQHCEWLRERLSTARREKWSGDMIDDLSLKLQTEECRVIANTATEAVDAGLNR